MNIELIINGQSKSFDKTFTLHKIIQELQIEDKVMAAAVNMEIVKKENWDKFIPQHNDKIELLEFVGGG